MRYLRHHTTQDACCWYFVFGSFFYSGKGIFLLHEKGSGEVQRGARKGERFLVEPQFPVFIFDRTVKKSLGADFLICSFLI